MELGKKLSILAKTRGVTQEELAKRLKISRISINRFFRGHTEIRAHDFIRLLQELDVDIIAQIDAELSNSLNGEPDAEATHATY